MELKMYFDILARRWRIALLTGLVVICLAALGSQFVSPKYQATAMLRIVTPLGGSFDNINYQTTFATRLINTYAQITVSEQVKNELRERLGVQHLPDITVKVIPESEILQIVVVGDGPALAARATNSLVDILMSYQDRVVKDVKSEELNILAARKEELQAELTQYQGQFDQLVQNYSQTTAEMAILDRVIKSKEASVPSPQSQKELESLYQQYKELATNSTDYLQRITLVRQMIQSAQSAYSDLRNQYDNLLLANSRQEKAQNIEVVSPATEPASSSGPGRLFVLGLGIVCGLITGIVAAFVADNLDTRIFAFEQIKPLTQTPIIGCISKIDEQNLHDIGSHPDLQRDYLLLCTKLQTLIQDSSIKTIMVTSPNMAEGKSEVVFGLALELAKRNLKVLVVDADHRMPKQHKLFDVMQERGLGDFLCGEEGNLKYFVVKNVQAGIDLLPNPTVSANPVRLIHSPQWNIVFDSLKSYDVVLFDTSAFLAVPDSLNLARTVEGVIVVAQWGHTTGGDIQTTCLDLESAGSRILGVVINQTPSRKDRDSNNSTTK